MAVELTPEEQAKFDERLKELGYDENANATLKKRDQLLRDSQAEVARFKEAEAKRQADEDAKKAEDDKKRLADEEERRKAEDAKKTLQEQLADFEKRFAEKLDAGNKEAEKKHRDLLKQIEQRDERILLQAVTDVAKERGVIEPSVVELLHLKGDLKKIKMVDGVPDAESIKEVIEGHATAFPALYKDSSEEQPQDRDDQGRFTRPTPKSKTAAPIDWSKLSPEEFAQKEREIVRART